MSQKRPAADWPPAPLLEVERGLSAPGSDDRSASRGRMPGAAPPVGVSWDPAALQLAASRFDGAFGEVAPILQWTIWLWRVRHWSRPPAVEGPPGSEAGIDYQSSVVAVGHAPQARVAALRELVFDAVARLGCEASLGEGRVSAAELWELLHDPDSLVRMLQRFRYAQRLRDKEHWGIERQRAEECAAAGIDRDVCTPCDPWRRIDLGGDEYRTALCLTVMLAETPADDAAPHALRGDFTGELLTETRRTAGECAPNAGAGRAVESAQQAVAFALFPILSNLGITVPAPQEATVATRLLGELVSDAALDRFRALGRWIREFRRSSPESPRNRLIDWMVPELNETHPPGRYRFEVSFRLFLRTRLRQFVLGGEWGTPPSQGPDALDQAFSRLTRDTLGELLSSAVSEAVEHVDHRSAYAETGLTPRSVRQTRELLAASA